MASNVRISTENMKLLRDAKKATGASIEFTVNKIISDDFKLGWSGPFDEVTEPAPEPEKKVVTPKTPVKRFVKPEFGELAAYFQEKGSLTCNDEAQTFLDHFNSNGWKVGGKAPMKNWKAAVNNWMRKKKNPSGYAAEKEAKADQRKQSLNTFFGSDDSTRVIGHE